jgi:hypothetical protein
VDSAKARRDRFRCGLNRLLPGNVRAPQTRGRPYFQARRSRR